MTWPHPLLFWSRQNLVLLAIFFAAALGLQSMAGAHGADFGYYEDEPSHYVTGLMFHDYLRTRPLPDPMEFARSYYHHYPKVALGQWPPVYYIVESAWMFVFGVSPFSVLALVALFTAFNATLVFWFASRVGNVWAAGSASVLFLLLYVVQELNASIMVDPAMTTGILAATAVCGSLLMAPRWHFVLLFAILATLSILTKANAILLSLVPVLASLLSGRVSFLMRRPLSWTVTPLIVAVGILPWYLTVSKIVAQTMSGHLSWDFTANAFVAYAGAIWSLFGPAGVALVTIGVWIPMRLAWRHELTPAAAVLPAMGISCLVFHCLVPNGPAVRYILPTAAWLSVAAAVGAHCLARRVPVSATGQNAIAVLALLLPFLVTSFHLFKKPDLGLRPAIESLYRSVPSAQPVVMVVSGQPIVEGAAVAEVARLDREHLWILYRGSKIASTSTWMGRSYDLLIKNPAELKAKLDSAPVHFILVEKGSWSTPHHELFRQLPLQFSGEFQELPVQANGQSFLKTAHPVGGCVHPLSITMQHTLGESITLPDNFCGPQKSPAGTGK